jgi:PAS domain S-box-containing protein
MELGMNDAEGASPRQVGAETETQTGAEFRLMADHLPTLCWMARADGYITWYNRGWHNYCGTTPEQMEGWGWTSVHDPELLPAIVERWRSSIETGQPFEMTFPLRGADGKFRPFLTRIRPYRDQAGKVRYWFGVNTEVSLQVEAEASLRLERDRYRRVLDGMGEGFALLNPDLCLLDINVEGMRNEKRSKDDLVGHLLSEVYPDADPAVAATFAKTLRKGEPQTLLHEYTWSSGRRSWLQLRTFPVEEGLAAFYRDVTEERDAEVALLESEVRYRTLFEAIEAGFCIVEMKFDENGRALDYRLIEAAPDLERHWFDTYGRVALTGQSEKFESFAKPFGRWFDVYAFRTGAPHQHRIAILFNDISDRRRADLELKELNETLEQRVAEALADRKLWADVFESTDALIAALGPDRRFLAFNKAYGEEFERIFGIKPQVGDDLREILASKPEHQAAALGLWDRALAGEEFVVAEEFGDPDRDRPYYELRFNSFRDRDGAPIGAFQYAVDITERFRAQAKLIEAQEQLRQSQKLEAVGQLTGGVAHDFNNLLTVIRGSVELLRRPNLSEERRARYVDAIGETSERAAKLTGQLLAFARRQALKPQVFEPATSLSALGDVIRTLAGSRVTIEVQDPAEPCWVHADPSQFDTAVINMAVNARDAMNAQGVLTIAVQPTSEVPALRGHAGSKGRFVAVCLTDTGSGILPDQLERIFEPFFTTKAVGQGTGLGLSQVFGFAKQSGGEVEVRSRPGEGATFILYLPRADAPERSADEEAPEPHLDGRGACVLVVEDNRDVGDFATRALAELGYQTVLAPNAEAALAELEADPSRFHIVFSDVVMPGMNGVQLGQEIRRRHGHLPVLLASGYSHVLAEQGDHGFELLHKPYSIEELSRLLARTVSSARGRAKG